MHAGRGRHVRSIGIAAMAAALIAAGFGGEAQAVILPPATIDGPNVDGMNLGGVAMAPDGTGGLVYTKVSGGAPHVFVSRYDGSSWGSPIRVDSSIPYEASEPRIAAGPGGRLLVVWVAPVASVGKGEIRDGLYSSSLGAGSGGFGEPLLVDPNVKAGAGVTPSLAGTTPGKAIVAYRVVTHVFGVTTEFSPIVQLRPGDVAAEIRVARLEGDRWSRLGPINRNLAASMRAPTEDNGPEVAIGATGRAVVAWQEPDVNGTARIWMRRVTGTTLGPVLGASPQTFEGKPVAEDATAFALGVTSLDRARVAALVDGGPGSVVGGQRMFLTSLGSSAKPGGGTAIGPEPVGGPSTAAVGEPEVAVAERSGTLEGALDLALTSGGAMRTVGVDAQGKLQSQRAISGPPAQPESPVVATVDPEGGGFNAYEGSDETGAAAVVVNQEFPTGESQSGFLSGPTGGPISQLLGGGSGQGDALFAFRQGESGQFSIVADRVSAPPGSFGVVVPKKWVTPRKAKLYWPVPPTSVGGLTYEVLVQGRPVVSNLTERTVTPAASLLGSGVDPVQVIATDRFGGEVESTTANLKVDGQPPSLKARLGHGSGSVHLEVADPDSGLRGGSIRIDFGDGTHKRGRPKIKHTYKGSGRYTITVRAVDRVGNKLFRKLEVAVR